MTSSRASSRVANPGCWATGFLALARPLVRAGLIPADFPVTVHGVSGYSGGGKSMIEEFEKRDSPVFVETVQRGLCAGTFAQAYSRNAGARRPRASAFVRAHRGAFLSRHAGGAAAAIMGACRAGQSPATCTRLLAQAYAGRPLVEVASLEEAAAMKSWMRSCLAGSNRMKLFVFANRAAEQARLVAVLDNLGKGAGGAAVQNLNIMLGLPETTGL